MDETTEKDGKEKEGVSYGERLLSELLLKLYPDQEVMRNFRPDFLRNPLTGKNLELDFFLPELRLAFEFQGKGHRHFYQSCKDETKQFLCRKNRITLREVWLDDLRRLARKALRASGDKVLYQKVISYADSFNEQKARPNGCGRRIGLRMVTNHEGMRVDEEKQAINKAFRAWLAGGCVGANPAAAAREVLKAQELFVSAEIKKSCRENRNRRRRAVKRSLR